MKITFNLLNHFILFGTSLFSIPGVADCYFADNNYATNFTVSITNPLAIPRNAPIGKIGNEILVSSKGPSTLVTCDWDNYNNIYTMSQLISPGSLTTNTGDSYVYQTNVSGIGFRIRTQGLEGSSLMYTAKDTLTAMWYTSKNESIGDTTTDTLYIGNVYLQFYITGPVTPGDITFNSPTLTEVRGPVENSNVGAITFSNLTITGSIPVTVLACETPDITVDLKKHDSSDFPRIGSTSATTAFNFTIKNCPTNLNSVNYTFKPASGITLKGSGDDQYLTLDGDSTASGVGIQMLYGDGSSIPFNSKTEYTDYVASTGGDYTIPMKARYVRTGTISPGTANSAVEFEMSYE